MARKSSKSTQRPRKPNTPTIVPSGSTEDAAIQHFNAVHPDTEVEYVAFDGLLDGYEIYELWYRDYGEWCVSFITHTDEAGYDYVDSIAKLLLMTSRRRGALERELQILREGKIRLYVASFAFLVSLGTLVLIASRSTSNNTAVLLAIIGVVSSGALFFFGAWVPAGIFTRAVRKIP